MPTGLFFWTDEAIKVLERLWETFPAKEIGALVGKTKNAVIGKANRLGLPMKKSKPRMKQARDIAPKAKRRTPFRKELIRIAPMVIEPPVPIDGGLHIMNLESHSCREVVGYGYPDLLARYCGHQKQDGSSYCGFHHAKNHNPITDAT